MSDTFDHGLDAMESLMNDDRLHNGQEGEDLYKFIRRSEIIDQTDKAYKIKDRFGVIFWIPKSTIKKETEEFLYCDAYVYINNYKEGLEIEKKKRVESK